MLRGLLSLGLMFAVAVTTVSVGSTLADDPPGGEKKGKGKGKGKHKSAEPGESKPADPDGSSEDGKNAWSPPPPGLDARVKEILIDLRGQFNLMDADVNWSLDADELARGFRGPKATVPEWGFGITASSEALQGRPKQDVIKSKYPDQYFLNTYDLDRNGRVTKEEFRTGFMTPVVDHYKDVFRKKDEMDKINQRLQLKTIDRVQRAKLEADMKILNTNLRAGLNGFNHMLGVNAMASRNAQWRSNVEWYHKLR